ncbi:hypothetical protein Vafri_15076, partial [Volvox africanus]
LLSPQEKEIARMVCLAFGQKVCGFDLLRSERGGSYVCDVNGWSFVKSSAKFYGDAADILRSIILQALAPHRLHLVPALPPAPTFGLMRESQQALAAAEAAVEAAAASGRCSLAGPDGLLRQDTFLPAAAAAAGQLDSAIAGLPGSPTTPGTPSSATAAGWGLPGEELRCVLVVVRHGDRTPKQKVKVVVHHPAFLDLYERHADPGKRPGLGRQAKLKSASQLQELLDVTRRLLQMTPANTVEATTACGAAAASPNSINGGGDGTVAMSTSLTSSLSPHGASLGESGSGGGSGGGGSAAAAVMAAEEMDLVAAETRAALAVVRSVLEAGGHFSGINRKAQLKPRSWLDLAVATYGSSSGTVGGSCSSGGGGSSSSGGGAYQKVTPHPHPNAKPPSTYGSGTTPHTTGRPGSLLLIVKWGGVLTHAGRAQAETLGVRFRTGMYPRAGPAGGGLLRLHSTYRHDFKVYSSDEGRVQTSAAAFTQGLLCLEGTALTPILVSLVNKDAAMLEAFGKGASYDMRAAKEELYKRLCWDSVARVSRCKLPAAPPPPSPVPTPPPSPRLRPASTPPQPSAASTLPHPTAATAATAAAAATMPPRVPNIAAIQNTAPHLSALSGNLPFSSTAPPGSQTDLATVLPSPHRQQPQQAQQPHHQRKTSSVNQGSLTRVTSSSLSSSSPPSMAAAVPPSPTSTSSVTPLSAAIKGLPEHPLE